MKLKEAYQLFKEEAKISIGFSTFAELRPSEVFPVSQRDHEVCMCNCVCTMKIFRCY